MSRPLNMSHFSVHSALAGVVLAATVIVVGQPWRMLEPPPPPPPDLQGEAIPGVPQGALSSGSSAYPSTLQEARDAAVIVPPHPSIIAAELAESGLSMPEAAAELEDLQDHAEVLEALSPATLEVLQSGAESTQSSFNFAQWLAALIQAIKAVLFG